MIRKSPLGIVNLMELSRSEKEKKKACIGLQDRKMVCFDNILTWRYLGHAKLKISPRSIPKASEVTFSVEPENCTMQNSRVSDYPGDPWPEAI